MKLSSIMEDLPNKFVPFNNPEDSQGATPLYSASTFNIEQKPAESNAYASSSTKPATTTRSADVVLDTKSASEHFPFTEALKLIVSNALPLIFVYFVLFSIRNLSLHLIKQRNDERLTTAVGVGNTLLNVIGIAIYMSLNAGLTSCSAHAFGAKNYQLLGFYLHRGLIINLIAMIPGGCILYWSDKFALYMGFDEITAQYTQQVTFYCLAGIFFMMLFNTLTAYLNACDIFIPPAIALIVSAVAFWVLSVILVQNYEMDILGIAISFNIMQLIAFLLVLAYILIKDPVPGSFFWFKEQSFKEIWSLFKYEFFVGSMIFLEWVCGEIIYIMAGSLSLTEVSALTIVYTNFQAWYSFPYSLSDVVLAFTGNAMGEGNIQKAKSFIKAGVFCALGAALLAEIFYFFLAWEAAEIYTNNYETIKKCVQIFRAYHLMYPSDFTQVILSTGLRAIGKEKLGSELFILVFYFIGIPLSYILSFKVGLNVMGLVFGPIGSNYILITLLLIVYCKINWQDQLKVIQQKLKNDNKGILLPNDGLASPEAQI